MVHASRQMLRPAPGTSCSESAAGGTSDNTPVLSTRGNFVPLETFDTVWRQFQLPQLEGATGI